MRFLLELLYLSKNICSFSNEYFFSLINYLTNILKEEKFTEIANEFFEILCIFLKDFNFPV